MCDKDCKLRADLEALFKNENFSTDENGDYYVPNHCLKLIEKLLVEHGIPFGNPDLPR